MDNSRYAELFLTESQEHLSAMNHALLELERSPDAPEPVNALFRAVHTVKGMSATMGYTAVAELAHELETLLDQVRRGDRRIGPEVMEVLFGAADALESAVVFCVAGRADEIDVTHLVTRLRALTASGAAPVPAVAAARVRGWTVPAPEGKGTLVRVRLGAHCELPGVRAFMALKTARELGEIVACAPPEQELTSGRFAGDFAFRLATKSRAPRIERALQAVGDVEAVAVGDAADVALDPVVDPAPQAAPVEAAPAEAATSAPSATGEAPAARPQRHVRMDLRRLDNLMNLIGELVITRDRLLQLTAHIEDPALEETVSQASRLITDLQDEIMSSRLVPVWQVFDRFPRLVRDAARALGKQIEFTVEGKEIELDRSLLDEIGDPIVHLLRNAVDHGLETPEARIAAGKPAEGRLLLEAVRDRSAVVIRVSDDGKGIDRARVLRKAKDAGLVDATKSELSDEELIRLISRPGFSTADRVTDISGRGVGIDAVQTRVRALGGTVEIRSTPNRGTSVTVRLPLTLAIVRALLARVDDELFAIPLTHVNETVEMKGATVKTVQGQEVLVLREDVLPLLRMRELVRLPQNGAHGGQVVVLEVGERRAGLVVDGLAGQQEIVVKQFDGVKDGIPLFSGATILGDGAPALIVDVSSLL